MKLLDLDPQWINRDGRRVGFTFLSPVGKQGNTHWRQSCFSEPTPRAVQDSLLGDAPVQRCNPACGWSINGVAGIATATFETMTVMPSIDGSAGGLWHGFITNGNIS